MISFYIDIIGYNVCECVKNEKNSASIRYTFASFVRCLQDVRIICNGICKRSEHSLDIFKNSVVWMAINRNILKTFVRRYK